MKGEATRECSDCDHQKYDGSKIRVRNRDVNIQAVASDKPEIANSSKSRPRCVAFRPLVHEHPSIQNGDMASWSEEQVSKSHASGHRAVCVSLNSVVLLQILSYCDPYTICRFSRSCKWAKELVDSNFCRLPHLNGTLHVTHFDMFYYKIEFPSTSRSLKVKSKLCDTEEILSRAKYVFISDADIDCYNISAARGRRLLGQLSSLCCDRFSFNLQAPGMGPHLFGNQIMIRASKDDVVLKHHMRNLVDMPFEAICNNVVPKEGGDDVSGLLDLAFQCPSFSGLYFCGTPRTMSQCIMPLVAALERFKRNSEPVGQVFMRFAIPPDDIMASTDAVSLLQTEMQQRSVLQLFDLKVRQVPGRFVVSVIRKSKSYAVHLTVLNGGHICELRLNLKNLHRNFIQRNDKRLMTRRIALRRFS